MRIVTVDDCILTACPVSPAEGQVEDYSINIINCSGVTSGISNTQTINICPSTSVVPGPTTVSVSGNSSIVPSGQTITGYEWTWGDGTTTATANASHTFPNAPGIYVVTLDIITNLGCRSLNSSSKIINVLPDPLFSDVTNSPIAINCGQSVNLIGTITSQTSTETPPPPLVSTVALPDGVGVSFSSSVDYSGYFPPGATLSASCYPTLCFNLEHSFANDIAIDLIAPNGVTVRVFNRHILSTGSGPSTLINAFGNCVNGSDVNPVAAGCPAQYCVVNSGGASWTALTSVTAGAPSANGTCAYTGVCENNLYYIP